MSYSNINRVVLVGRLTSDPELRALPSGSNVCELRIACNTTRKTAEGDYAEKPNFFNVSVFGPAGESVHRYMSRGRRVAIDGRLDWHEWETPEGTNDRRSRSSPRAFSSWTVAAIRLAQRVLRGGGLAPTALEAEERELVGVGSGIEDDLVF